MRKATYSVLIVEDMFDARELLKSYVHARDDLFLAGFAADGKEALDMLAERDFDVLLIDIDLPFISGIEVVEKIHERKKKGQHVIFTTAYDHYAVKAFSIGTVDYLLKPFSLERFNQAIDRFVALFHNNVNYFNSLKNSALFFKEKRKQRIVAFADILYLSSHGKNTGVHSKYKVFTASCILKELEEKLPAALFVRIHKQFIVNITCVLGIEYDKGSQYIVKLKDDDDTILPVGRSFISHLKKRLGID
jgi:DNA-binding LytR/AlgR family response regulator